FVEAGDYDGEPESVGEVVALERPTVSLAAAGHASPGRQRSALYAGRSIRGRLRRNKSLSIPRRELERAAVGDVGVGELAADADELLLAVDEGLDHLGIEVLP